MDWFPRASGGFGQHTMPNTERKWLLVYNDWAQTVWPSCGSDPSSSEHHDLATVTSLVLIRVTAGTFPPSPESIPSSNVTTMYNFVFIYSQCVVKRKTFMHLWRIFDLLWLPFPTVLRKVGNVRSPGLSYLPTSQQASCRKSRESQNYKCFLFKRMGNDKIPALNLTARVSPIFSWSAFLRGTNVTNTEASIVPFSPAKCRSPQMDCDPR